MNTMNKEAPERQDIEALLPWHAAGTLSRRDAERVEQALASDRELARRFDLVREELGETIHLNESLAPRRRARWRSCSLRSTPREPARREKRRSISSAASSSSCRASRRARWLGRRPPRRWRSSLQAAVLTTIVVAIKGSRATSAWRRHSASRRGSRSSASCRRPAPTEITRFLGVHKAAVVRRPQARWPLSDAACSHADAEGRRGHKVIKGHEGRDPDRRDSSPAA